MKRIDRQKHKVDEKNRYKTITEKNQIIIALSLRKSDFHINRLSHKEYGNTKKWCTYSVNREGKVFEHYDPKYYSDFIGSKQIDKKSISIVLENMGSLVKDDDDHYISWLNEVCPNDRVIEKKWMSQKYWEIFDDEQLKGVVSLCKKLCKEFKIPKKIIEFHQHHKDTIKFEGIVLKSNYYEDSSSINPLFDIVKFSELLNS